MFKKITKKSIAVLMLILTLLSTFSNFVNATEINSAVVKNGGECGRHLQFFDTNQNAWSYIITHYAYYEEGGRQYPAYCLDKDAPGVGTPQAGESYGVNVNQVMNDVRLWRVAINGYPYQTPEAMGVANYQDAFVATKQAVYCIIYNRDPNSYYKGADTQGVAIKNAIINLVNIGRNGSQTPMNTDVKANKIGAFFEDGDYYSQEYIVDSPVDTSEYSIVSTAGMPNGAKITDMSNTEKTTFVGNEHFKVRIPKVQLDKDVNVTIVLRAKCKTYPVFYGKTTVPGTQDYMLTFDPYGDVSGQAKLNLKTNTGKIQINKTDDETRGPIEGVTFQLQKTDGTVIGNATTDKNGQASFSMLYQGKYVLKEISTNEKYILNKSTFDVDVEYNKTATKNITNEHKKGNLKVYKVDKDNHKIPLGNVNFDLYSEEFKRIIGTYTTNVDGEFQVNDLRIGEYKLIEKNTGKWYNLADDKIVEVKWDTTEESIVENELKKGQIKVIKVDKDNKETRIEGVTFEVLDENNKVLEKITTNQNGEVLTSRYPIRDFQKLKIREVETLENYVLSDEVQTITLEENQIVSTTFENEKKKGQVRIIKVDKDNSEILLEGVTFDVLDENKNIVDTIKTGKDGTATSKRLPIDQKYTLVEKETREEYVLTEETQTITLEQDKIKDLTFQNEKKKGQVRVIKVDKDDNEILLEGVTFDVLDENKNTVDTIKTGKDGTATSRRLPIDQKYTLVEKETREEYVLTEETQTITLEQDKIKDLTFENEKIKGYIEITKISEDDNKYNGLAAGTPLEGAIFDIYDSENNIVDTITTDENGKAMTKLLVKGNYTVKEKSSGSIYYLLNENKYNAEIKEHKKIVPLTIANKSVEISVDVQKTGYIETQKNDTIKYDFSNVANTSNVYLDSFKWKDYLPTDYIRLTEIVTGTWNQDITYSITYKTNLNNEDRILANNLNSKENHKIDCTNIGLQEGEYITEYCFNFGRVDVGFKEDIAPSIFCKVLDTVKNKDTFTNKTETTGEHEDLTDKAEDEWTTVVYEKDLHANKLPKTGN